MSQEIQKIFNSAKNESDYIGIPPETCPDIDEIIRELDYLRDHLSYMRKCCGSYESVEDFAQALPDFPDVFGKLEELRNSNNRLRILGKLWYHAAKNILEEAEDRLALGSLFEEGK